ncbi:hypothetical protein [Streptomyces luteireticuli]|uniref:Secreted protein n=1 Tax=Streptomyces luteireticuli TaxID=173858 RepID=A0ABN0YL78_9ACTN
MKRPGRLIVGAAALVLATGGAFAVSSATAEAGPGARTLSGTTYWAKVSAEGTLLGGSGITGVNHWGGGRYNLYTSFGLDSCALTGTLNTKGGQDPGPGNSSVLVGEVYSNTLFVRTATPSSVDDDRPFSLVIVCP